MGYPLRTSPTRNKPQPRALRGTDAKEFPSYPLVALPYLPLVLAMIPLEELLAGSSPSCCELFRVRFRPGESRGVAAARCDRGPTSRCPT
jgi:hypothetical protein